MDKVWFICIDEKEEGPFSAKELSLDPRVNLDTLVWKAGFPDWVPLRNIKELRKYFMKEPRKEESDDLFSKKLPPQEEIAIDQGKDPNFYFYLLLLAAVVLLYLLYEIYHMP